MANWSCSNNDNQVHIKSRDLLKEESSATAVMNSGSLGALFYKTMFENMDKIHQVDCSSGQADTCGAIREKALKIATELQSMNVCPDDIIVMCTRSHPDQTVILLSIFFVGAIVAPIDSELTLTDMKETLYKLRPKLIFCDFRNVAHIEKSLSEAKLQKSVQIIHVGGDINKQTRKNYWSLEILLVTSQPDIGFQPVVTIQDPKKKIALIIATQGTSGRQKLVCHTDYSLRYQIYMQKDVVFKKVPKRILTFLPLHWILQFVICCMSYVTSTVRILPSPPTIFSERSVLRLIHDFKVDTLVMTTKNCLKIIKHDSVNDFNLDCLENIYIGGTISTASDVATIHRRVAGAKIIQFYALTEMCGIVASNTEDYSFDLNNNNLATTGKLLPGFKIKLIEMLSKYSNSSRNWGEFAVSGPSMMVKYFKDNPSSSSIERGYFRSGDIAEYDSKGYLYIIGRVTDLIERNNIQYTLTEIEEIIMGHPYVAEVAVVANDKDILACVIKVDDTDLDVKMLEEFIVENIAPHLRPTKIKIMAEFPKTNLGITKKEILVQNLLRISIQRTSSISI